jgi:hypothetical protein
MPFSSQQTKVSKPITSACTAVGNNWLASYHHDEYEYELYHSIFINIFGEQLKLNAAT